MIDRFDRPAIKEDVWFRLYQNVLRGMANTSFGRDLLCIDHQPYPIVELRKNAVTYHLGGNRFKTDFRVGAKWGNVIRRRWSEFESYSRYFQNDDRGQQFSPLTKYARSLVATTLTAYPDPHAETTTVDGYIYHGPQSWADARADTDGAPTIEVSDSGTVLKVVSQVESSVTFYIVRAFTLFDTSSLTASATITSADYSLYNIAAQRLDQDNDAQAYIALVGNANPASNTAIIATDYDQTGSTEMSDTHIDITNLGSDGYQTWTVNATGLTNISKTGITKWALREGHDLEDSQVAGANALSQAGFSSADVADVTQDPKLVVEYTVASARYLSLLGVGT